MDDKRRDRPAAPAEAALPERVATVSAALTLMGRCGGVRGAVVVFGADGATVLATHPDGALSDADHDGVDDLQVAIIDLVRARLEGHPPGSPETGGWRAVPWHAGVTRGAVVVAREGVGDEIAAWVAGALAAGGAAADEATRALGDGLVVAGADGIVQMATAFAGELLGIAPEALVGRPLQELCGEGTTTELAAVEPAETLRVPIAGPGGVALQARVERGVDGHVVVRLGRAADREPRAIRRDQLVAAIRHEVRTPLTVLRGVTSMLEEEPEMELEDRVGFLASLRKETHRVITIVEDLLTIGRMEAARTLTRLQPIDLVVIASELASEVRDFCAQHGVALEVQLAPAPLIVLAERQLLEQLVRSMIGHVLRAAPRDTRLVLRVLAEGKVGRLELEDDDAGVAEADRGDVFTSFRRSTATGKYAPGVGIGLAVAKHIADAHGWALRHEAAPGRNLLVLRAPLD